jgi:hypothetical protein
MFAKPSVPNRPFAPLAQALKQNRHLAGVFTAKYAILFIATAYSLGTARAAEPTLPYTVQPADKLILLANQMLTGPAAWGEVAKFNKLRNPNQIRAGQKIDIPLRLLRSTDAPTKVVSTQGDVTLAGQPVTVGQLVPVGAPLKTGANSSAVLELADASRVQVLPNTLAEVANSRHYAMRDASASGSTTWFSGLIRLAQGTLETLAAKSVNRATPLQVQTPTSLVGVRGTQFRVAYEDPASKNARTEVVEGLVRADNAAQGSGADLPMGTGAVINPAVREVKAVKLLPAPDANALTADVVRTTGAAGPALWALPAVAGAQAYRVQVATDPKFDQLVRNVVVAAAPAGSNTPVSADLSSLSNGNWYARVRGIDGIGLEGFDAVKLVRLADGRVSLIWPGQIAVDATARYMRGDTQLAIQRAPDAPAQLTAVLASDEAMTQVLQRQAFTGNRLNLGALQPGQRIYVQFEGAGAGNQVGKSDVLLLQVPLSWGDTVVTMAGALQKLR